MRNFYLTKDYGDNTGIEVEVYLLWGKGRQPPFQGGDRRVYYNGKAHITTLIVKNKASKDKLKEHGYEFKEWV